MMENFYWTQFSIKIAVKANMTKSMMNRPLNFTFVGDCIVDFHLPKLDELTIVELSQKNIPTDKESKKNIRLGFDSGWVF
jgi:predicted nucleotidyltransferase